MIVETNYICEVCRRKYSEPEGAHECENRGLPNREMWPVGLLTKIKWDGKRYGIFAASYEWRVSGHNVDEAKWAYRSWEVLSDEIINLKEFQLCGNGYYPEKVIPEYHSLSDADLNLRETKWMIRQLKANNIVPSYYNSKGELIKIN